MAADESWIVDRGSDGGLHRTDVGDQSRGLGDYLGDGCGKRSHRGGDKADVGGGVDAGAVDHPELDGLGFAIRVGVAAVNGPAPFA